MGIYLGTSELGGGSAGGGGYIPGIIGFEYFALSGGGGGISGGAYGHGGGGAGSLVHGFAYAQKDVSIPIVIGAGGSSAKGGDTIIGEGLLITTILGGWAGTYKTDLTDDFGTCPGGRGSTTGSDTALARKGNGFTSKGTIIGVLDTPAVNGSAKTINETGTPFTNGRTYGFSGPGGAGLGGNAADAAYNTGSVGGIGLDPTTITDRFLTQAEYQTEGIGEVTSSVAYIGGGGSGRTSSRANPPGGGGAQNNSGLANTGGGGGAGSGSGGSGFAMLRLPTSQSVTTVGVSNTYTKGDDTVYVWKSTGSITLNS